MKKIMIAAALMNTGMVFSQLNKVSLVKKDDHPEARASAMAFRQGREISGHTVQHAHPSSQGNGICAVKKNKMVHISWQSPETDADIFTIQRTKDGTHFETVSIVKAYGKSSSSLQYNETDYSPRRGSSFYRLETTSVSGEKKYSELVRVNGKSKPARKKLLKRKVNFAQFDNQEVLLVLKNKEGREQYSKFILIADNKELIAVDIEKRVNPGEYEVIATSNDKILGIKVTVK